MTSVEAQELYNAFQDAMGNWERTPFDRLTVREMDAWEKATGYTSPLQDTINDLRQEIRVLESDLEREHKTAEEAWDKAREFRQQSEDAAIEIGCLIGLLMEASL